MHGRFVGAVIATMVVLAGCTSPAPPSSPSPSATPVGTPVSPTVSPTSPRLAFAELPTFDGSTAVIPLLSLVIQRLTGATAPEADNAVSVSTTPNAYRALVDGSADLLIVYEADAAVKQEVADSEVKLDSQPLGRDALVFFTNASNPVTSLSTDQFRRIYTGEITNWKQVGGQDSDIIAYQRPESSGSQALLRKYVMGRSAMAKAPGELISAEMGEIIEGVSSYANSANALGYSVYYYLANMYAVEGISMLAVDGVRPSPESIGSGSYPYVNNFFVIIRADEPAGSPARTVRDWLLSPQGTQTVRDAGYVPAG